jgi:4-carboxymuconolactone decarboxylase
MMKKFIDMATETVFGALWTRPGLDLKTRTLICVVSDAATARTPELAIHLRMARRQGWTEDELIEVLAEADDPQAKKRRNVSPTNRASAS